jgi:hypothetical protein
MKQTFILGYTDSNDIDFENPQDLSLFPDKKTAAFESEEWCEVEADNEQEAREKYHQTFAAWQANPY